MSVHRFLALSTGPLSLALTVTLAGIAPAAASSVTYHALLESVADAPTGSEVYRLSYPDVDAVQAGAFTFAGFTQIGISADFSIAGMAYDGAFQVLLESDADAPTGNEVYLLSYPTIDAVQAGAFTFAGFTQIGISAGFSIAGLTYDGAFRILLESDTDAPTGSEVYLLSYSDRAALIAGTFFEAGFTQIGISDGFSIAGFTYDGAYQVLLESDTDAPTGSEVYRLSYPTIDALKAGAFTFAGFTQIGISEGFSIRAFEAVATAAPPPDGSGPGTSPAPIPLPAAGWLLLAGLGLLGAVRRGGGDVGQGLACASALPPR
ncbi:hypothetical protein [Pararhodobacter sp. SW119]|uniref:hypothetical protein n=1 Tax=Pararhodobacter sp. SW119 TaxID=2780075 RepID=UPI001AE079CE|nr:hypothetical protein [Pararhodobacter sp. SW119]